MTIDVQKKTDTEYIVSVVPDTGIVTQHTVTLHPKYYRMLTGGSISEKKLIVRSFEFLLTKESNDAILPEFDLSDISQYFPEYEKEIKKRR
ncbi:MAG: hypothetical protein KAS07_00085 [Candidatus Pacebacteria bacterium]|nr:hypothetical protein [Candidatus Paceibacterota bacterium]